MISSSPVKDNLNMLFSEGKTPIELLRQNEKFNYDYAQRCHKEWCESKGLNTNRQSDRKIVEFDDETFFPVEYSQSDNYRISATGKILGLHNCKLLSICHDIYGATMVTLRLSDGKSTKKSISLARLVGLTFLPPKENDKQILIHLDGNPDNNCVNNLKYIDYRFKLFFKLVGDFLNCFNGAGFYYQFFSDPSLKSETSFNDIGKNEDLPDYTAWKEISY